jgi:hypothetical protein
MTSRVCQFNENHPKDDCPCGLPAIARLQVDDLPTQDACGLHLGPFVNTLSKNADTLWVQGILPGGMLGTKSSIRGRR